MLVEIALGDSYGAGFEFAKAERLAELKNDLSTYYPHNLPGHLPAGSYTDDTQMSIAIAEFLLENKSSIGKNFELKMANKWVSVFKRDPRNGYSRKFQEILEQVSSGEELLAKIIPNSDRCGAAMRSCPIGYISNTQRVKLFAKKQAKITHNTPEAISSSIAIALSTHYFLHTQNPYKQTLLPFLLSFKEISNVFIDENDLWPKNKRCSSEAIPCVKAAISAVVRNDSLSGCLKECIDYTGDVDSIAAMALGIASCCKQYKNDLPEHLYSTLENGMYGLDFLKKLDKRFHKGMKSVTSY